MSDIYAKDGFTLFEIMVLVAIIALLMAIVVPNYLGAREKTIKNICITNQKMIFTAATAYQTQQSEPLTSLDDLVDKNYLKGNKWCECPASYDGDYDDYTLVFEDGFICDVECDERGEEHRWP